MNTIQHAFKSVGVKLPPVNKRIWLWLNDHPGRTSKEVANAVGVARATVSSQLGNMVSRGMITRTSEPHPHRDATQYRYATCIREFELLPLPRAHTAKDGLSSGAELGRVVPVSMLPSQPSPVAIPRNPEKSQLPPVLLGVLENYSLRELRVINEGLNKLFEYLPR